MRELELLSTIAVAEEVSMAQGHNEEMLAVLTSNEGEAGPEVLAVRRARNRSNALLPIALSAAVVICMLALTFSFASTAYAVNVSRSEYIDARKEHKSLDSEWKRIHEEALQVLTNCTAAVSDASLCVALDASVTDANKRYQTAPAEIDPYEASTKAVEVAADRLTAINSALESSISDLKGRMEPIYESVATKSHSDYEASLQALDELIAKSKSLVDEVGLTVRDDDGNYYDSTDETVARLRDNAGHLSASLDQASLKLSEMRDKGNFGSRDLSVATKNLEQILVGLSTERDSLAEQFDTWKHNKELEEAKTSASASASAAAAEELRQAQASASASASAQAQEIERLRRAQLEEDTQEVEPTETSTDVNQDTTEFVADQEEEDGEG